MSQSLGLNDALSMPLADAFDPKPVQWSYRAEAAGDAFNAALWSGLGAGAEPDVRDRGDLGEDRLTRLQAIKPARCAS